MRGSRGGEFDNRELISKIMTIRANRAKLLGYANHAAYGLEDQTARTPEAVNAMLGQLAPAAVANAKREAADLQAIINKEGGDFELAPWDWAYYTEKVRADYVGFTIPDLFVIGYGLDYAERYRNLPFVGVLKPEMYRE